MEGLTEKQEQRIEKYLCKQSWNHIYDKILTKKQRKNKETMKYISFGMEDILKKVAAMFGLCGMNNK